MSTKITINPLTRISGSLQIEIEVSNHKVVDARSGGMMFRGFEKMLEGRPPQDAVYITERICGICSIAHATASASALEDAYGVPLSENSLMFRDFMHAFEYIQNHIRHFYQFTLPDYVKIPEISLRETDQGDYRLPAQLNKKLAEHYMDSISYSRLAHELQAVLGGKAPHSHGICVGGTTSSLDITDASKLQSSLTDIRAFVDGVVLPDTEVIAKYYAEGFRCGASYGNFMTYGAFDSYHDGRFYVKPSVYMDGKLFPFSSDYITENVQHAWYVGTSEASPPENPPSQENVHKASGYSFIKAPRYYGRPMEVGPLARMIISGEYRGGISYMARTVARMLELRKVIGIAEELLKHIALSPPENRTGLDTYGYKRGKGLIDTTRGALGHWLAITDDRIQNYGIISPSTWNLSPADEKGLRGPVEQALIGTSIQNVNKPVEIGRIVRSFDPCVSCATHIISDTVAPFDIKVL